MPIESMYGMVYHRAGYYIRRSPKGKRTMKAYLWKVCGQEYDAEHQG